MGEMKGSHAPFRYFLIRPSGCKNRTEIELYNRVYQFWFNFWSDVFRANGSDSVPSPDEFWRQDYLSLIMVGDEIVGLQCHTTFDLATKASRDHSYLKNLRSDWFFDQLWQQGTRWVMSLEYFCIADAWRRHAMAMQLSRALGGLSVCIANAIGVESLVGLARTDVPSAKIAYEFGAVPVNQGVVRHNTPCDVIAVLPHVMGHHKSDAVRELTLRLWEERTVLGDQMISKRKGEAA